MSSPTDEDLERLREFHNLDLSKVKNIEDLKNALNNTTSRGGSKFGLDRQISAREQLVSQVKSWFGLEDVQDAVGDNNIKIIDEIETLPQARKYLKESFPDGLNTSTDIKIERALIEIQEQLISQTEALKFRIQNPTTVEQFEDDVEELKYIAPQTLGGLKRGELSSSGKAFRLLFQ